MSSSFVSWLSQLLGREEPRPPLTAPKAGNPAEPYHAVSVKPGLECCEAAKQLGGMRFLSAKAPRLPLPDCHVAVCTCRYSHYSDRRSGVDRRAGHDWNRERELNFVNRRQNHGRRATDAVAFPGGEGPVP